MRFAPGGSVIGTLRAALLLLAGLGVVGTAAELAMERHWQGPWQLLPWLSLGMIALALGVLLVRRTRPAVRFARICAALVILTAAVGVWRHVQENYDTAPLDARYTDRWETMSNVQRWWEVGRGSVGPAPLLAPGVLLYIGVALAAATSGLGGLPHPITEGGERRADPAGE